MSEEKEARGVDERGGGAEMTDGAKLLNHVVYRLSRAVDRGDSTAFTQEEAALLLLALDVIQEGNPIVHDLDEPETPIEWRRNLSDLRHNPKLEEWWRLMNTRQVEGERQNADSQLGKVALPFIGDVT